MYSHRVNIENRLSDPNTVKKGHLSMMSFDEEMEAFDQIDNADIHPAEHAYPAILRRYLKGKASKNMYTIARIHSEIFEQPKLLPPNTVLDINFDRHDSDFLLLTKHNNRNYIRKMESCELLTRLVDMDEEMSTPRANSTLTQETQANDAYCQIIPGMSERLYPTLIGDGLLSTPATDNHSTLQRQITAEVDKYLQEATEKRERDDNYYDG